MSTRILTGDCRETLKTLGEGTVQCVVTSPPYWGLRDYGADGQIGLEVTPDEYIAAMVEVFREVRRVLRDDGVCWLNLGDSYTSRGRDSRAPDMKDSKGDRENESRPPTPSGLKPKDLVGIPWRVAFALQADGWWLRQDIIWSKNNPMPEPVTDRCTRSHEYLFMLTKSERYFYDAEAIKEPLASPGAMSPFGTKHAHAQNAQFSHSGRVYDAGAVGSRNKRSVWTVNPRPYDGAHFAVMPPMLVEPCVLAGTSEAGCCPTCGAPWERETERVGGTSGDNLGLREDAPRAGIRGSGLSGAPPSHMIGKTVTKGWAPTCQCPEHTPVPCTVLDPFGGSGTVGMVSRWLGRDAVLCELNPEYVKLIEERVVMERTDTGGARRVEPAVGGGASLDLLGDVFGE